VADSLDSACKALEVESHPLIFIGAQSLQGDGQELCQRLRTSCGPQAVILAVTGNNQPEHLENLLATGVDDYLAEPNDERLIQLRVEVAERWSESLRHSNEELRQSEERYRLIADNVTDMIWTAKLEGLRDFRERFGNGGSSQLAERLLSWWRFTYLSPSVERLLGYSVEEGESLTLSDLLLPESYAIAAAVLAKELVTEQDEARDLRRQRTIELYHRTKQGSVLCCEVTTTFLRDEDNRAVGLLGVTRDITERKHAEEALRESEGTLRNLIENMPDLVVMVDRGAIIRYVNRGTADASVNDLLGSDVYSNVSPEHRPLCRRAFDEVCETQEVQTVNVLDAFGSWWSCRLVPMIDKGEVRNVMIISTDVTEHRKAEEALRRSERQYRTLVEAAQEGVAICDPDEKITFANQAFADQLGYTKEELVGLNLRELTHASEFAKYQEETERRREGKSSRYETELLTKTGEVRCFSLSATPLYDAAGTFMGAMGLLTDITERKKSEEALRQKQEFLMQLLELFERDRELMAYEIHDGFSQQLTGAVLNFEAADQLREVDFQRAQESFLNGIRLLRDSIAESRRLISGLRPPVLDEFGIVPAIEHLVNESQAYGPAEIELVSGIRSQRLARPLESTVFRIVQETLTNAQRHSRSDKVRVELLQTDDHIRIVVQDWGVGFDPHKVSEARLGLKGIRERARLFGGRATIDTAPGRGTRVVVELPVIEKMPGENDQPES